MNKTHAEEPEKAVEAPQEPTDTSEPEGTDEVVAPEGSVTNAHTIPEIKAWLEERNIPYPPKANKQTLLNMAAEYEFNMTNRPTTDDEELDMPDEQPDWVPEENTQTEFSTADLFQPEA